MGHLFADPSHQLFAGFNAFFSLTWQKTRVEQVSLKVFHLWCILGNPIGAKRPSLQHIKMRVEEEQRALKK